MNQAAKETAAEHAIPTLQWERYGKFTVGLDGSRVVCIIAKPEDAPLEMWTVQFTDLAFTSLEAAQAEAEKDYTQMSAPRLNPYVAMLETALAVFKSETAKREVAQ
jgi:hypothetical protein